MAIWPYGHYGAKWPYRNIAIMASKMEFIAIYNLSLKIFVRYLPPLLSPAGSWKVELFDGEINREPFLSFSTFSIHLYLNFEMF